MKNHLTLKQVHDLLRPAFHSLAGKERPLSDRPAGMSRQEARLMRAQEGLSSYIKDDTEIVLECEDGSEHVVLTADELHGATSTDQYLALVNQRLAPLRKP